MTSTEIESWALTKAKTSSLRLVGWVLGNHRAMALLELLPSQVRASWSSDVEALVTCNVLAHCLIYPVVGKHDADRG